MHNKIIAAVAVAGLAFAAVAITPEQAKELVNTPNEQITSANAVSIVDAAVMLTNYWKIATVRAAGFISFEDVAAKLAGKPEFAQAIVYNAKDSGDDALIASAYEQLLSFTTANSAPYAFDALAFAMMRIDKLNTPDTRIAATKALIDAGMTVKAIRIAYGELPAAVFLGTGIKRLPQFGADYAAFCKEHAENFLAAWLAAEPGTRPDGKMNNIWLDGADVVCYFLATDATRVNACAEKIAIYAKAGQPAFIGHNGTLGAASRNAFLESEVGSEADKIKVAKISDYYAKNKAATIKLYPSLKDQANKVKIAVYLDDADKIIDALKTVNDKLDAETINSIIAPLNAVDAGYRTADLRLALMNVNKKYTLKLYEDRDTWEPILSKIRAMIDTL